MIEVKLSDTQVAKSLFYFQQYAPHATLLQLVKEIPDQRNYPSGVTVAPASKWLQHVKIGFEI